MPRDAKLERAVRKDDLEEVRAALRQPGVSLQDVNEHGSTIVHFAASLGCEASLRILLDDGSRVVVRLSGTGTKGATIRVYLESYVPSSGDLNQDPQVALAEMISAINDLAEIKQRTGMDQPTVIT